MTFNGVGWGWFCWVFFNYKLALYIPAGFKYVVLEIKQITQIVFISYTFELNAETKRLSASDSWMENPSPGGLSQVFEDAPSVGLVGVGAGMNNKPVHEHVIGSKQNQ